MYYYVLYTILDAVTTTSMSGINKMKTKEFIPLSYTQLTIPKLSVIMLHTYTHTHIVILGMEWNIITCRFCRRRCCSLNFTLLVLLIENWLSKYMGLGVHINYDKNGISISGCMHMHIAHKRISKEEEKNWKCTNYFNNH